MIILCLGTWRLWRRGDTISSEPITSSIFHQSSFSKFWRPIFRRIFIFFEIKKCKHSQSLLKFVRNSLVLIKSVSEINKIESQFTMRLFLTAAMLLLLLAAVVVQMAESSKSTNVRGGGSARGKRDAAPPATPLATGEAATTTPSSEPTSPADIPTGDDSGAAGEGHEKTEQVFLKIFYQ